MGYSIVNLVGKAIGSVKLTSSLDCAPHLDGCGAVLQDGCGSVLQARHHDTIL